MQPVMLMQHRDEDQRREACHRHQQNYVPNMHWGLWHHRDNELRHRGNEASDNPCQPPECQ